MSHVHLEGQGLPVTLAAVFQLGTEALRSKEFQRLALWMFRLPAPETGARYVCITNDDCVCPLLLLIHRQDTGRSCLYSQICQPCTDSQVTSALLDASTRSCAAEHQECQPQLPAMRPGAARTLFSPGGSERCVPLQMSFLTFMSDLLRCWVKLMKSVPLSPSQ